MCGCRGAVYLRFHPIYRYKKGKHYTRRLLQLNSRIKELEDYISDLKRLFFRKFRVNEKILRNIPNNKCKINVIDRNACYVQFESTNNKSKSKYNLVNISKSIGFNKFNEEIIVDYDYKGKIIGFEILGGKECQKRIKNL